ncbi:hypothetical protein [Hyphomonas sp. KY3]|uniref:hypothetical protein n=1 Tax=Hyphomonas sp. KY3 TaxID=2016196 RepID=UPI001A8F1E03|nr:hypothetical protein [Hyphomonas sp. KY3]QSR22096.1 hypothetical protein CFA77_07285 [Hyphomonas sp. KY3]
MDITELHDNRLIVEASREDLRILEIALRAGKVVDQSLRHAFDDETDKLHRMVELGLSDMHGKAVALALSQRQLLNMSSIVGAVNTMDPELFFPSMTDEFPSDDDLDTFSRHIEDLYDKAFNR